VLVAPSARARLPGCAPSTVLATFSVGPTAHAFGRRELGPFKLQGRDFSPNPAAVKALGRDLKSRPAAARPRVGTSGIRVPLVPTLLRRRPDSGFFHAAVVAVVGYGRRSTLSVTLKLSRGGLSLWPVGGNALAMLAGRVFSQIFSAKPRVGSSKAGRFYCASIGVSCGGLAWKTLATLATTAPWLAPHTAGLEDPRHHRPLARPAHSWPGRPSPPPPLGLEDPAWVLSPRNRWRWSCRKSRSCRVARSRSLNRRSCRVARSRSLNRRSCERLMAIRRPLLPHPTPALNA
jgi:hypothetical protein